MQEAQADRDEWVRDQRRLRAMIDRHDTETEAQLRWELRAQARVAIAAFRVGCCPRPDLVGHRMRHSDAVRWEMAA